MVISNLDLFKIIPFLTVKRSPFFKITLCRDFATQKWRGISNFKPDPGCVKRYQFLERWVSNKLTFFYVNFITCAKLVIPIHSSKISKNESNKSSLPGLGLEWTDMYRIQNIKKEHYYLIVCGENIFQKM